MTPSPSLFDSSGGDDLDVFDEWERLPLMLIESAYLPEIPGRLIAPSMNNHSETKGSFSFVSLGCPKNLVDSERMLGLLAQDGYSLVPDAGDADIVIINTCGFIDAARQESLGVIREMIARKNAGAIKGVVVAGCLAEPR